MSQPGFEAVKFQSFSGFVHHMVAPRGLACSHERDSDVTRAGSLGVFPGSSPERTPGGCDCAGELRSRCSRHSSARRWRPVVPVRRPAQCTAGDNPRIGHRSRTNLWRVDKVRGNRKVRCRAVQIRPECRPERADDALLADWAAVHGQEEARRAGKGSAPRTGYFVIDWSRMEAVVGRWRVRARGARIRRRRRDHGLHDDRPPMGATEKATTRTARWPR